MSIMERFDDLMKKFGYEEYPKLNLGSTDSHWIVQAIVPGVKLEDISVEVTPSRSVIIAGTLNNLKFKREVSILGGLSNCPEEAILKDGILTLKWVKVEKIENKVVDIKEG